MTIHTVLHNIQKTLSVPKNKKNTFGGYNYRSAEDIVDAVKALLPEGYSLLLTDSMIILGDRFYIEATATLHGEKDKIECKGYAREPLTKKGFDESQITGAASSYARKYALNGLFAIDDGIDADSQDNRQVPPNPPNPPKALTPEQKIEAAKKKAEVIILAYKGCKDLNELAIVQESYHTELKRYSEAYPDIFKEINTVHLQVIGRFDQ